jgi:CRP-like cAMP-binding protein
MIRSKSMPAARSEAIANAVLRALPGPTYRALRASMHPVELTFGDILYEQGETIRDVYFPGDSLVSLLTVVDGRSALEVGLVGHDGMVGIPLALGSNVSGVRALVQGGGRALRMNGASFQRKFGRTPALRRTVYRYLDSLMAQITRTAACNRFHRVEARLARWLLMTSDRVRSTQFRLTHEFLSHMLGVRRSGVTEAASGLQRRKLIRYVRGRITILDRRGLQAASCGCYAALRAGR